MSLAPQAGCLSRSAVAALQQRRSSRRQRPATCAADPEQPSSSGSDSNAGGAGSTYSRSPWELMGRVVREDRIALQFDRQLNMGLVRSAAARESGLPLEQFELRLTRLLTLMPFLQDRLPRMRPKLLAALAADPDRVAARLIQLRSLLPAADVAAVAAVRPSLLLDGEWEGVAERAAALGRHYSEAEVARIVQAEPLLLAEELQGVLEELQRLLPGQAPLAALLDQPTLASKVSRLGHLSLWLVGDGGDARALLLSNPAVVHSVQRGTLRLGPGAEF